MSYNLKLLFGWFVKNLLGMYVCTYKEPPVHELEVLRNGREVCRFAMQYYIMYCSCTELKISPEVMCKPTFTNCLRICRESAKLMKVFCKVPFGCVISTANKYRSVVS